ncbi:NucA/NucB deoxyribonuclease domain-containing protein [Micromonospora sp. URMC 106]|uniref:NucA/NucB deoxyribonuclease domain-containing protein n=1 Tax=Micromonospora sp. URMC 106 TaxID=3423408 RepID=UPI003F1AD0A6
MARLESRSPQGWARSRFEQCFIGGRTAHLLSRQNGAIVATVEFGYSLLAFSVDGSRRVDYVFDFDTFDTKGGEPLPTTTLTVDFVGCAANVVCAPSPTMRAATIPEWLAGNRLYNFSITSPNDTGDGDFKIVRSLIQMNMSIITLAPDVHPWQEAAMANSRVRFDSARAALGSGKYHGAVFSDSVPTVEFSAAPTSDHFEQAIHIEDALVAPRRTFPSLFNKSVPGEGDRPLHRLMNDTLKNKNHSTSVGICVDVWGAGYPTGGLECDEYPFQSTYEGSATSTGATEQNPNGGDGNAWHGSARPITGSHNSKGGALLGTFFGQNRVLDENRGTSNQGVRSDPFRVRIVR